MTHNHVLEVPGMPPGCTCTITVAERDGSLRVIYDVDVVGHPYRTEQPGGLPTGAGSVTDAFVECLTEVEDFLAGVLGPGGKFRKGEKTKVEGSLSAVKKKLAELRSEANASLEPDSATIEASLKQIEAGEVVSADEAIAQLESEIAPDPIAGLERIAAIGVPTTPTDYPSHDDEIIAAAQAAEKAMQERVAKEGEIVVAKAELKVLEKAEQKLNDALRAIILGKNEKLPLFDRQATPEDTAAALADEHAWKDEPISVLGFSDALAAKLADAGIKTMGDLDARHANGKLSAIKGMGPDTKTLALVINSLEAWLREHSPAHKRAFEEAAAVAKPFTLEDAIASIGHTIAPDDDSEPGAERWVISSASGMKLRANTAEAWDFYHANKGIGIGETPDDYRSDSFDDEDDAEHVGDDHDEPTDLEGRLDAAFNEVE